MRLYWLAAALVVLAGICSAETADGPGSVDKQYLTGRTDYSKDQRFTAVPVKYADRRGIYLRKDVLAAFIRMSEAASRQGVRLVILSGGRNFWDQKSIWEAKWKGAQLVGGLDLASAIPDHKKRALEILKYSSMPGTSRHHWGTDMDLNNLENSYFDSGYGKKVYDWLLSNAPGFGFYQPYTKKGADRPAGYEEERWHWSYVPVSRVLLQRYDELMHYDDIYGFEGSETAKELDTIAVYVRGVNPLCK